MSNSSEIFKDDALNRVAFAANLSKLVGKLPTGVVAIDGAWGSGKSWFGERLRRVLEDDLKTKCVWIDTFDSDWHDDPALSLLSAFVEQIPQEKRAAFLDAIAPFAAKTLPAIAKAALRAAGNAVGIDSEIVNEVSDATKDSGDEYIKKRLQDMADRKRSLEAIKNLLAKAVDDFGGKLVVFVDELDRCSPAYAIRFLERIKHLFALDGVVFVLLWNRIQIQHAVRAFYGQETDGQMYLDRFVDYSCHLPNHHLHGRVEAMGLLVEKEIQRHTGHAQRLLETVRRILGAYADVLHLTAREVKHLCNWWILSPAKSNIPVEMWLLCLKAKFPTIYAGLGVESKEAHQAAGNLLASVENNDNMFQIMDALRRFHKVCETRDAADFGNYAQLIFDRNYSGPTNMTSSIISRIESVIP
jgi:KAP family P-loop domain